MADLKCIFVSITMCTYCLLFVNPSGITGQHSRSEQCLYVHITLHTKPPPLSVQMIHLVIVSLGLGILDCTLTDRMLSAGVKLLFVSQSSVRCCSLCREQTAFACTDMFNPGGDLLCCSIEVSVKVRYARSEVHHKLKPSSNTQTCLCNSSTVADEVWQRANSCQLTVFNPQQGLTLTAAECRPLPIKYHSRQS